MTRMFAGLTALIYAFLVLFPARIQAPAPEIFLSAPVESATGEAQTWYLSFSFPAGQDVSNLLIENGLPEAWSFSPVAVQAPGRSELVKIQVVSLKSGRFQPRLLIAYTADQVDTHKIILGEMATIQSVEGSFLMQVVSSSAVVEKNKETQLTIIAENRSPFPIDARLNIEFPGVNPAPASQSIQLKAGEQRAVNFNIHIPNVGIPIVKAAIQWKDSQNVDYSALVQSSGAQIETEADPLISFVPPFLSGVLAGILTGFFAIAGTYISFNLAGKKEQVEKSRRDLNQTEGLLLMVELNTQQALTNKKLVDMKFLDQLLLDNNLYQVLHKRKLDDVTRNLWTAADMYNNKFDSAQYVEFKNKLKAAFDNFNIVLNNTVTASQEIPG